MNTARPATRWLDLPQLVWTPGAWDQQIARLANPATAPRYIVELHPFDYADRDADGALRAIVARDYALETTIGGAHVYRRKD